MLRKYDKYCFLRTKIFQPRWNEIGTLIVAELIIVCRYCRVGFQYPSVSNTRPIPHFAKLQVFFFEGGCFVEVLGPFLVYLPSDPPELPIGAPGGAIGWVLETQVLGQNGVCFCFSFSVQTNTK